MQLLLFNWPRYSRHFPELSPFLVKPMVSTIDTKHVWFACYCHAFHPSQDIAIFAVFEFVDLQMKPLHSAFHRTVITSKLCILSSLLTILFFCYFSYCSDGFSSIWCCLLSFVLHFVQKVEHMGCTYLDGCSIYVCNQLW